MNHAVALARNRCRHSGPAFTTHARSIEFRLDGWSYGTSFRRCGYCLRTQFHDARGKAGHRDALASGEAGRFEPLALQADQRHTLLNLKTRAQFFDGQRAFHVGSPWRGVLDEVDFGPARCPRNHVRNGGHPCRCQMGNPVNNPTGSVRHRSERQPDAGRRVVVGGEALSRDPTSPLV